MGASQGLDTGQFIAVSIACRLVKLPQSEELRELKKFRGLGYAEYIDSTLEI